MGPATPRRTRPTSTATSAFSTASLKGSGWYASGRLGYAWHDYYTERFLTVPFTDVATATHSGNQYTAASEFGSPLRFMVGTLTPVASLNYSRLDQDAYTETSGAGMGLAIASQETDSLASGLGLKALVPIAAKTLLEARAIWYHEFEDTNQQVTAAFAGGPDFTAGPERGPRHRQRRAGPARLLGLGDDLPAQLRRAAAARFHRPHRLGPLEVGLLIPPTAAARTGG